MSVARIKTSGLIVCVVKVLILALTEFAALIAFTVMHGNCCAAVNSEQLTVNSKLLFASSAY
jgi:hypothetical protein